MNPKQQQFVNEYLICFNATEAARRAGYTGNANTLGVTGFELLRNPKISELISQRLNETAMTADEVLMRLAAEGRGDMGDFWDIPEHGDPWLNLASGRAKGKSHLIKKLKVKRTVRTIKDEDIVTIEAEIELYDSQAAKRLIGQAHKLFTDKIDIGGDKDNPVVVEHLLNDTIAKIYGTNTG